MPHKQREFGILGIFTDFYTIKQKRVKEGSDTIPKHYIIVEAGS